MIKKISLWSIPAVLSRLIFDRIAISKADKTSLALLESSASFHGLVTVGMAPWRTELGSSTPRCWLL